MALESCQLKDIVTSKPEKLDALVTDMGENWSVGQKQLLCFGRVILKRSQILFMDEATASVNSQTDAAIQRIIREEFTECTVIGIAHRILTVMDSVLSPGVERRSSGRIRRTLQVDGEAITLWCDGSGVCKSLF